MYFIVIVVAIIIALLIISIYKFNIDDEQKINVKDSVKIEDIQHENSKEIILYLNTNIVRFSFYNYNIFSTYQAKKYYNKVVQKNLYIDEPFHTSFVQLIQIYAQTQSWLKSNKTKEIKLKIRNKNANFEEGISFKVHSVSEILFDFLENILEYLDETIYSNENKKNIILSALLWKLDNVREIQYLCMENLNEIKYRECLAKKILKYYDRNHDVFKILKMIEYKHENIKFMPSMYNKTIECQQEYSYVDKGEEEYKKININDLANKSMKQLMEVDDFSVY